MRAKAGNRTWEATASVASNGAIARRSAYWYWPSADGADEAPDQHPVGLLADPLHDPGGDHVPAEADQLPPHPERGEARPRAATAPAPR